MADEKNPNLRYSKDELAEFDTLLNQKLERSRNELDHLLKSIKRSAGGGDENHNRIRTLEDGADVLEKEQLNQLAARTQKYIQQLDKININYLNQQSQNL
jgi:hypothetical protein